MSAQIMNPDSTMMQQCEGHWQQYLALVLAKLAPQGVTITLADIERFAASGPQIVLTHGHYDSIEFKLVTPEEAQRLIAYDRQMRGRA